MADAEPTRSGDYSPVAPDGLAVPVGSRALPGGCCPVEPDGFPGPPDDCSQEHPAAEHCDCCLLPDDCFRVLPAGCSALPDDWCLDRPAAEHCDCCLLPGDCFPLRADSPAQLAVPGHCDCCLLPDDCFLTLQADSLVQAAVLEHYDCCLLPGGLPEHQADSRAVPDARLHCWSAEDWRLHGHHAPRA
jgi:hypothetical protein